MLTHSRKSASSDAGRDIDERQNVSEKLTEVLSTTIGRESAWQPAYADGIRTGDTEWLVEPNDDSTFSSGVWRVLPGDAPEKWEFNFESDEMFHVVEGKLEIDIIDGDTRVYGAGDVALVPGGTKSYFRIVEAPFKKVFMSV